MCVRVKRFWNVSGIQMNVVGHCRSGMFSLCNSYHRLEHVTVTYVVSTGIAWTNENDHPMSFTSVRFHSEPNIQHRNRIECNERLVAKVHTETQIICIIKAPLAPSFTHWTISTTHMKWILLLYLCFLCVCDFLILLSILTHTEFTVSYFLLLLLDCFGLFSPIHRPKTHKWVSPRL